ncbi:hypothetical protein [Niastella sp. OAS944]|uniref:hypothetical protein n=1 Tax=Niastella sp. OAS944 TaxID=2664089 RepID=UPI00346F3582|nr:hypothetical protein [Chitinophagaceae bacterium OAS944]
MKKTVLSVLALSALVFACKKDKDDNNGLSEQALLGKWEMKVQYRNVVTNNIGKRDTLVIPEGLQAWEFLKNGIIVRHGRSVGGVTRDTGFFKLNGSNVIITEEGATKGDTTKITQFANTELQAYKKLINSSTKYTEFWFNYKKQ